LRALALAVLCFSGEALAEEPREVLIGTFALRPQPAAGAGSTPASQVQGAQDRDSRGQAAADMLADALGRLGAGDRAGAGRTFEQLVAAHPDTREAQHARRYLGEAYRADPDLGRAAAETVPPQPAPAIASPAGQADAAPAAQTVDGWRVSIRAETALEHRLISEVGDRVFFSLGSAELGTRARTVLAAQAKWLKRQPRINAIIEGHADDPGSEAENRALAEARAKVVRERLIEEGVPAERLEAAGRGREERIAECGEPECAAQNRRAVTLPYTRGSGDAPGPLSDAARGKDDHAPRTSAVTGSALSAVDTGGR
jgi:peptidoglycan-associated lipoprotein